jgi:hypothetical protein
VNDEQSKRLSDAADAIISASDAMAEARDALADKRFESDQERDRTQAIQQVAGKVDNAGKRIDDALRKAVIACAALAREGAYQRYLEATALVREGRALGKTAPDQDGSAAKRERAEAAISSLDKALAAAASLVFGS